MKSKPIKRKNESTAETRLRWLNRISAAVLVLSLFIVYSITAIRATGTLTPTMELLDGHAAIRFVDVGQGDCTLVTHRGHAVLIDAGPTSNAQATAETVRMYAPRIDAFFVTHPHEDHMGGAEAVLKACKVENLILPDAESGEGFYRNALNEAGKSGTAVITQDGGAVYTFGDIRVEVYDTSGVFWGDNLNNASLPLRITVDGMTLFVSGDAEVGEEGYLVANYADLSADILQVNHHGSSTSSTEDFLRRVNPKIAVISVGRNNAYGHPSMQTVTRLEELGAVIRRTDREGTIVIRGSEFLLDRDGES